jgi:hypothetical protein
VAKKENMVMKKKRNLKMAVICVALGLIGAGALVCIILSMVTGKVTPYLAMGLGLAAIGNMVGSVTNLKKKEGKINGSDEDGSIS